MRRSDPLILGAGPAGAAAAITLAAGGHRPVILERARATGDALCGGFLSWRTLESLETLGIDPKVLGGHSISRLRVIAGDRMAEAPLPGGAIGVSRRRMDTALLARAEALGAGLERGVTARAIDADGTLRLDDGASLTPATLFAATGKHDLRGLGRPRPGEDAAVGLRLRVPASAASTRLIGDAIELFLFDGGYAGVELQEDGSANICMAVRKSRLAREGGQPMALFEALARDCPALGERMALGGAIDAIGHVPYGWIARATPPGLFRLGDQAAVIPSLAGEGNGIALASGISAARAWMSAGSEGAPAWQAGFGARAARPVGTAMALWRAAEHPAGAALATRVLRLAPVLAEWLARRTRIAA